MWNHRSPSRTSCSLCATVQIGSPIATHRDPSALRIALPLRRGSRVFSNRERCNIITSSLHSSVVVAIYGRMFESTRRHFASWIQTRGLRLNSFRVSVLSSIPDFSHIFIARTCCIRVRVFFRGVVIVLEHNVQQQRRGS